MLIKLSRILVLLCASFVLTGTFVPARTFAATYFENNTFTSDITFKKKNGPYIFTGYNYIPKNISIIFEAGSIIDIQGQLYVYGKLALPGIPNLKTTINISGDNSNISIVGGELYGEYMEGKTNGMFLNAWASSTVILKNSSLDSGFSQNSLISAWQNSSLDIVESTFKNSDAMYGVQIFGGASAIFEDVVFDHAGQTAVSVYGIQNVNGSIVKTTASFFATRFISPQRYGVEIFNGAYTKIQGSIVSGFEESAISVHGNATLDIENSIIQQNKIGIESYSSLVKITDSDISLNTRYGALQSGGEFIAEGNWWGDQTGPYNLSTNVSGKGNAYEGTGSFSPWLTQKKKEVCCSSILFIPGLGASRIYKKGVFENQLWEPNRNADVRKLFLDSTGQPIDKTLYTKDIIYKTNVGFGAQILEVYSGFVYALNQMVDKFTIRDWQYAAYDWRMSPYNIILSGFRTSPDAELKTMEQQIEQMVQTSKTKKVTLIAHSYGGLVTKRLLGYLSTRNKLHLIDKVILVAVPEQGTPSALFALLHGDNQEIGNGFILNKDTARKLSLNMPSTYVLLPSDVFSINTPIISGKNNSDDIPIINTADLLNKFLFNKMARPVSVSTDAVHIPAVGNEIVNTKIKTELQTFGQIDLNSQKESASTIKYYNILGVGLKTPKSIVYEKGNQYTCATMYGTDYSRLLSSDAPYCALTHTQSNSLLGDGNVLIGDTLKRLGDLYFFRMNEFNEIEKKNYSHMNIVSAQPVISLLMQIMLGNVGYFDLPAYITHNQGSRYVAQNTSQFPGQHAFEIQTSDTVYVSTKDSAHQDVGVVGQSSDTASQDVADHVRVDAISPNSSVGQIGDSYVITRSELPQEITLKPKPSEVGMSYVDIEVKSVQIDITNDAEIKKSIFTFEDIPMTEYSTVEIKVDPATVSQVLNNSGSVGSGGISTTPPAALVVTSAIGEVFRGTETYYPATVGGQDYTVPGNTSGNGGVGQDQTTSQMGQIGGGSIDVLFLIESIRSDILRSSLRTNFKQRYLLKLKTAETYIRSAKLIQSEARIKTAVKYTAGITTSLEAIIKDLNRYRSFYYRGGMNKPEAMFLYSEFVKLSKAYVGKIP